MKKDGKRKNVKETEPLQSLVKTADMALSMKLQKHGVIIESITGGNSDSLFPTTHYFRISVKQIASLIDKKGNAIFTADELENLEKAKKVEKTIFPTTKVEMMGERFKPPNESNEKTSGGVIE